MATKTHRRLSRAACGVTDNWDQKSASFWLDICRRHSIDRGHIKASMIGGTADAPFEQALSNLAHVFIKDKAPKLLDYEVGFQLVDKNEENTKAIGVFGFKIGQQWLMAPVFFLNGKLKGHEMLYIKNQDVFVPLKENWINYLLGRKPDILGEPVGRDLSRLGVNPPYLSQLSRSPSKFASALPRMPKWLADFMPVLAYCATTSPDADPVLSKSAGFADICRATGYEAAEALLKLAYSRPALLKAVDRFYPGLLDELVRTPKTAACGGMKKKPKKRRHVLPKKWSKLSVYEMDKMALSDLDDADLSRTDRQKLVRERLLIKDERTDDDVTVAYSTTEPLELRNPGETGIYEVLVKPHHFRRCLVITAPYSHERRHPFCTVIALADGKAWCNAPAGNIWVRNQATPEVFRKWWESLPEAKSLPHEGQHVLLGPRGEGTTPFRVTQEYAGDEAEDQPEYYEVHFDHYADAPHTRYNTETYDRRQEPAYCLPCSTFEHIVLTKRRGSAMRLSNGELSIPAGYKIYTLRNQEKPSDSRDELLRPGAYVDMHMAIMANTQPLNIIVHDNRFKLNDKTASYTGAVAYLVRDVGLRREAAELLLKQAEAAPGRMQSWRIKQAVPGQHPGDMTTSGPNFQLNTDAVTGYDPMTGGLMPATAPTMREIPIPEMSTYNTDRNIYDPRGPDQQALAVAQQAAQTGQREVFDTAMFGSMLKAVRQDSMVDRYLGDLMKGLDRLCRVLFLLYWHGDEFADRYGSQDLPELEDGLRNAIEVVGDVVLALKSKSIEPDLGDGSDVDLSSVANN